MPSNYNHPSYWEEKYEKDQAGWDSGNPNPIFVQLIKKNHFLQPGRILIVGAGKGYDAIEAAKEGFDVTAVDFSVKAISFAEELANQNNVKINFLAEDIFKLDEKYFNSFDAVYDYVFYCAIDPQRRLEYADVVAKLLNQLGKFVSVLFPVDDRIGGPPFSVNPVEAYENFSRHLKLEFSSKIVDSIKPRKGREVLQIYVKPGN
jgi:SAM-dependent methyltransferase